MLLCQLVYHQMTLGHMLQSNLYAKLFCNTQSRKDVIAGMSVSL